MACVPLLAFVHGGGGRFGGCVMVALRGSGFLSADVGPGILQVGRGDHASTAQLAKQGAQLEVGRSYADFEGALRGNILRADATHPAGSKAKVAGHGTVCATDTHQPTEVGFGGVFHVSKLGTKCLSCQRGNCLGFKFRYGLHMKEGDKFERAVVALLDERITAAGLSHSEFARAVMDGDPVRSWRLCRAKTGKSRRMSLAETYAAAKFFGEDFANMIWSLERQAKERGMLD